MSNNELVVNPGPRARLSRCWAAISHRPDLILAASVLVVLIVYLPSLRAYFVQDDWFHLDHLPPTIPDIWVKPSAFFFRPLFLTVFALFMKAFGLNALPWHALQILLHLGNMLLVRALARRLNVAPNAATAAALVFGLFPRAVDVVAWPSAISGALAAFFGLMAVLVALSRRFPPIVRALICAVLWGAAMCSKEEAVGFALLLPLVPLIAGRLRRPFDYAQWALGCLAFIPLGLWFMKMERASAPFYGNTAPTLNVDTILRALAFTSATAGTPFSLLLLRNAPALVLALGAIVLCVSLWRRHRRILLAVVWILSLSVPIGAALDLSLLHDRFPYRFAYLPSIGLALCLGAGLDWLTRSRRAHTAVTWALLATGLLALLQLGSDTFRLPGLLFAATVVFIQFARPIGGRANTVGVTGSAALYRCLPFLLSMPGISISPGTYWTTGLPFVVVAVLWGTRGLLPAREERTDWAFLVIWSFTAFCCSLPQFGWLLAAALAGWLFSIAWPRLELGDGVKEGLAAHAQRLRPRLLSVSVALYVIVLSMSWLAASRGEVAQWAATGRACQRAVLAVSPLLKSLPRNAMVRVNDPPVGWLLAWAEPIRFGPIARALGRPDLLFARGERPSAPPTPEDAFIRDHAAWEITWTSGPHPDLHPVVPEARPSGVPGQPVR